MLSGIPLTHLRILLTRRSWISLLKGNLLKPAILCSSGLLFLILETLFFHRIFDFLFNRTDPSLFLVSRALSLELLQLVFLVFGAMLIYSNLITSISVYLTSNDMKALLVWPISTLSLYGHKFIETLIRSSAVLVVFVIPVLSTYGYARNAPWEYYLWIHLLLALFIMMPCAVAVPSMLLLARIFPTQRLQQGLIALGLVATVMGLFAFRMLRVEAVFFNSGRPDQLIRWAAEFRLPDWSWVPSSWLVQAIDSVLPGGDENRISSHAIQLFSGAILLTGISCLISVPLLRSTWSRSYGVSHKRIGGLTWMRFGLFRLPGLQRPDSAMALKEVKVFARDLSRWSQLVMMIPLIGFYLLNMQLLPFRDQFREIYYLLNLFMIAFIQAAIGARYLFPSISWEGPALWLVRVSPYPVWRLVLLKFLFLTLPLLMLTLVLTVLSFWILDFDKATLPSSLLMALMTTLFLSGLAVGFGAVLPRFRYEHHLEISLGPGGVLYMLTALFFCIVYISLIMQPALSAMGERLWDWGNWSFSKLHPPSWQLCFGWSVFAMSGTGMALTLGTFCLARREEFDR